MSPEIKYFEDYLGSYGFNRYKKLIFPPASPGKYKLNKGEIMSINFLIINYDWEWCYCSGKETIEIKK